ncbi:hypothetical protein MJA45_25130 [Paenibacillus aurantius]|uniref:Uncharacterized protein n=1 Tax=Paenibacillus aurantius TaxID=2918900 RepID=A0AA96LF03_9BACL|nr:hypothetical protein [Paenibacillus aurantius]WNQ10865.1 hypothetical protein MJA45_25130 [Paenibacillus aurantius]
MVKTSRLLPWPALLAAAVSLLLLGGSLFLAAPKHRPLPSGRTGSQTQGQGTQGRSSKDSLGAPGEGQAPGSFRPKHEEEGGPFKLLGTFAVASGAVSFGWYGFRRRLGSRQLLLKKAGRLLHSVHTYAGWLTLALIAVHGGYYLVTKLGERDMYTGLAAFVLLLAIAGYGYAYRKVRKLAMRRAHFVLATLWVPILLIHAGGSAIAAAAATVAVWGAAALLDKKTAKPTGAV